VDRADACRRNFGLGGGVAAASWEGYVREYRVHYGQAVIVRGGNICAWVHYGQAVRGKRREEDRDTWQCTPGRW